MKESLIALLLLCEALLTAHVQAAGFDCSKASSFVEKTVCSDRELSNLDDLLATSYKRALSKSSDLNSLKSQQREWIKQGRDQCKDIACIRAAYSKRLAELNTLQDEAADATPKSSTPPQENFSGEYSLVDGSKFCSGGMDVKQEGNSISISFDTVCTKAQNLCNYEGKGILTDNQVIFKEPECTITVKFAGHGVETTQEGVCSEACGFNARLGGKYVLKKDSKKQDEGK